MAGAPSVTLSHEATSTVEDTTKNSGAERWDVRLLLAYGPSISTPISQFLGQEKQSSETPTLTLKCFHLGVTQDSSTHVSLAKTSHAGTPNFKRAGTAFPCVLRSREPDVDE